jgi:hypothetical protein
MLGLPAFEADLPPPAEAGFANAGATASAEHADPSIFVW